MKRWKIMLFLPALGTLLASTPALGEAPQGVFSFQRDLNKLWIGDVVVSYNPDALYTDDTLYLVHSGVTTVKIPVHTATCPSQNHIKHEITVIFDEGNGGQGHFERSTVIEGSDKEDRDLTASVTANGFYGIPSEGSVRLVVKTQCIYHGVNQRGGPRWAPQNW